MICVSTVATGCSRQSPAASSVYDRELIVGDKMLSAQVVSTPEEMEQGLSGRAGMEDGQGMLFDFGKGATVTPNFWMKDMNFSLDFIWIKNNKVIGITKNVPAPIKSQGQKIKDNELPLYPPPSPVDAVLEVNAGWTERNKIKIGDEVRLR